MLEERSDRGEREGILKDISIICFSFCCILSYFIFVVHFESFHQKYPSPGRGVLS